MLPNRTTTRDIRRQNRSALLSRLFFDGPRSRFELGQLTGLSAATVSSVTGELMEDGLVVEAGQVESNGGRPRVLLRVDPAYGYVVGIDVGETGVAIERFDLAMARRATYFAPLPSNRPTPDEVASSIATGFEAVMYESGEPADPGRLLGVGVGVPGIVESEPRLLVHTPTLGWSNVPLAEMLAEHGVTGPIHVDNGARTQAQAEVWFGAARGARQAIVALIGSGVGAAIVRDGETYQGASSSATEWGHTVVRYGGRLCRCGDSGHLEAYVGAEAILDRWAEAAGHGDGASSGTARPSAAVAGAPPGGAPSAADPSGEQAGFAALIAAAAEPGSPAAALLAETIDILGAGIGSLINMFNPDRVVLGGWAGLALGAAMLPQIRSATAAHALSQPYGRVAIELSHLGSDAVALGAATLPLGELLACAERPAAT